MKSRITIEVDFDNSNEPVIQIMSRKSDDVRDNLIQAFYQKLGSSSWCKIIFRQDSGFDIPEDERFKRIIITPIPDSQLKEEAGIMLEQFKVKEVYYGSKKD